MDLNGVLRGGRIAIDTAVFIYFIENNAQFGPVSAAVFEAVAAGRVHAVTSALTMLEVLVLPLRNGDEATASSYRRILTGSANLTLVDIDHNVLTTAARLRATTKLRTPDAIQVATALEQRCRYFLTNDLRIPRVGDVEVIALSELV